MNEANPHADVPAVRLATRADQRQITATLALAFAADPAMRFLLPDASRYHALAQELIGAAVSVAVEHASLHMVEGYHGAAVWFAPGARVPQAKVHELVRKAVEEHRIEEVTAGMISSGGFDPGGACWHLQMIGVDPLRQGQGIASCLLRHGLEGIDERRAMAYLPCSNPKCVPLYERHGFEVKREAPMAEGIRIFHMVRTAR